MSLDLDAIEQRAAAATPGPWWTEEWSCGRTVTDKPQGTLLDAEDGGMPVVERVTDAEFVAHAREDVPALVAEVKRLREDNAALAASKSDDWQTGYDTGCAMSHSIGCGAAQDHRDFLLAEVKRLEAEVGELSYIAEACRGALQLAPPDHGTVYLAIDRCVAEKLGGVS